MRVLCLPIGEPRDGAGSRRLAGVVRAMDGGARLGERGDVQFGGACWVALREAAARWSSGGGPRMRCDGCEATGPSARTKEQDEGRMT